MWIFEEKRNPKSPVASAQKRLLLTSLILLQAWVYVGFFLQNGLIVHDHLYLDCHTQPRVIFLTSIVENSKDTLVKILLNGWWIFIQMIQSDPSYLWHMPLRLF